MELIRARRLLPRHDATPIDDAGLVVHAGRVVELGRFADLRGSYAGASVELPGTVIPGLVDAHSHLRGLPLEAQGIVPRHLDEWLPTLSAVTELPPRLDALVAAGGLLRTGVTSVQAIVHSYEDAAGAATTFRATREGVARAGLRALLVLGFSDCGEFAPEPRDARTASFPRAPRHLPSAALSQLLATLRADLTGDGADEELVRAGVGPVGPQWCTDTALVDLAHCSGELRLHTHLNESSAQRTWLEGGGTPCERLARHGLLRPALSAAHGVHLRDHELELLAAHGVSLVHCASSNRRLGVGAARVRDWLRAGIDVGLGLDSQQATATAPDMFEEMREVRRTAQALGAPLSAREVLRMATVGGGRALGDDRIGELRPGAFADLVELDLGLDLNHGSRDVEALVETVTAADVRSVWVGGRQQVRDGELEVAHEVETAERELRALADADAADRATRLRAVEALLQVPPRAEVDR